LKPGKINSRRHWEKPQKKRAPWNRGSILKKNFFMCWKGRKKLEEPKPEGDGKKAEARKSLRRRAFPKATPDKRGN